MEEINKLIDAIDAMTALIKANRRNFTAEQIEDLGNSVEDLMNEIDEALDKLQ
jgi:flagellar hook-associated protein FlgK